MGLTSHPGAVASPQGGTGVYIDSLSCTHQMLIPIARFPFGMGLTSHPGAVACPQGGTQAFQ